ncbi:SDR family NAD(P)-dependent oxidoreductase [Qipengyuania soli]|uniref:SDR family NAD(P)-dependent oxidoreductase n=1 Tax=Qipengyuania soli TaxID=2782568 RepID=A0A7S8F4R5_9SPHN|nr:SDR family NAD(P)-dependent oxidoreductase [Qipengyuania soli]QPC99111.1 SDR family NAD(P)-dependent oxidoreductase [Qipengyuania soli]
MAEKVFLVIGAGAGIGGHAARRFAAGGYHAVLARRSDEEGLQRLVDGIVADGGSASGRLIDASLPDTIEDLIDDVERAIGPVEAALFNLGAQIGNRPLAATTPRMFELGWRLATFAPYRLARALLPRMAERGRGAFLVTSATAAVRGNSGQASHAAAMGGRRMLCQSLNAEFAPQGVHVAHILIDAAVDAPDTLGKMIGDRWDAFKDRMGEDGLVDPGAVAETYWHIAHQPRSAWTFEADIRPYRDVPWWNDNPITAIERN